MVLVLTSMRLGKLSCFIADDADDDDDDDDDDDEDDDDQGSANQQ